MIAVGNDMSDDAADIGILPPSINCRIREANLNYAVLPPSFVPNAALAPNKLLVLCPESLRIRGDGGESNQKSNRISVSSRSHRRPRAPNFRALPRKFGLTGRRRNEERRKKRKNSADVLAHIRRAITMHRGSALTVHRDDKQASDLHRTPVLLRFMLIP